MANVTISFRRENPTHHHVNSVTAMSIALWQVFYSLLTYLTTWITLPNHFLWLPLPVGGLKIWSNWPHWHVRILSGQANNKQTLSKIDYLIISQLLISYHHSDVMYKKFHPTAQMLSCSNIVLSSNFDPSNFFAISWQNLSMPIIFF